MEGVVNIQMTSLDNGRKKRSVSTLHSMYIAIILAI